MPSGPEVPVTVLVDLLHLVRQVALVEVIDHLPAELVHEVGNILVCPEHMVDDPALVEDLDISWGVDEAVKEHEEVGEEGLCILIALLIRHKVEEKGDCVVVDVQRRDLENLV